MRARRGTALAVTAALLLAGCQQEAQRSSSDPRSEASTSTPPAPPTPSEQLGLGTGWGPSRDELDSAAQEVRRMPLPALAGQVIVASYDGTAAPVALVRRLHLGGVIVFDENVASTPALRAANRRLTQQIHRPLMISVDQEGGIVERVKGDLTRFPAFMSTGAARDTGLTERAYAASGAELRGLGFTADFAPNADVTVGPQDPVIGSRAAAGSPQAVADQVVAAARGFADAGMLPVVKHFPGHGSVTDDSHVTLPVQRRSLAELRKRDLVPFARAVQEGLPAVMVGHLAVPALQPGIPTSLSRPAVRGLLRSDLGFDGLVFTDALDMQAVAGRFPSGVAAVRALNAGVDVLLMPADPAAARAGIVRAVRQQRLPRRRLEQAATRMLAWQAHQSAGTARQARPGAGRRAAAALSEAAVTSVAGPCRGRLVGDDLVPFGDPVAVANFKAAAARAGLGLGRLIERERPPRKVVRTVRQPPRRTVVKKGKKKIVKLVPRPPKRVVDYVPQPPEIIIDGTRMDFAGYGDPTPSSSVVVATDTPYVLGRSSAGVRIASYGNTPEAMNALVQVLLGRARAPGRLPVKVPGVDRQGC